MTFGEVVYKTRKEKGITFGKLADMSGVTVPTIARIEKSDTSASFKKIEKVCEALELKATIQVQ